MCRRTFRCPKTTNDNRKKNSVPWWNTHLRVLRKKVNANRQLFQRTNNNDTLRERRKSMYKEGKRNYQCEINKAKFNSWKEYCNVHGKRIPFPIQLPFNPLNIRLEDIEIPECLNLTMLKKD
jgi:hypothetical protein